MLAATRRSWSTPARASRNEELQAEVRRCIDPRKRPTARPRAAGAGGARLNIDPGRATSTAIDHGAADALRPGAARRRTPSRWRGRRGRCGATCAAGAGARAAAAAACAGEASTARGCAAVVLRGDPRC